MDHRARVAAKGLPPPYLLAPLYSAGQVIGQFAWILALAVQNALGVMLLLLVLTIVLRRRWLATAAFFLIAVALLGIGGGSPVVVIAWAALVALVVTRYGILAMTANTLFVLSATWFPLTLDLNAFGGDLISEQRQGRREKGEGRRQKAEGRREK